MADYTQIAQLLAGAPPMPRPKPERDLSDVIGMYGYDAQGRELGPTATPPGGHLGGTGASPQPGGYHTPIGYDANGKPNLFDDSVDQSVIDNLPQGTGAPGQNVSRPYNPDLQAVMTAPSTVEPALNGPMADAQGNPVQSMNGIEGLRQTIQAQYNALRPQNDPQFQAKTAAMARHDAEMTPYQDKVLHDVETFTPSSEVREYMAPARRAVAQIQDLIAQSLGGPTPDDPLRGRTYNRNPQGLPPDTGRPGVIGRNF